MSTNPKPYEVMMKCGHAANAETEMLDGSRKPVCVICIGIVPGADEVAETPNLEGRTARCTYGNHADVPSQIKLPFFEHLPNEEFDRYYCGCYGWD